MIWLTNDGNTLVFDVVLNTKKGKIFCICIKRNNDMDNETVIDTHPVSMMIQDAHAKSVHVVKEATTKAATYLGWELMKGGLKPCEAWSAGKENQNNLPKENYHVEYKVNSGRLFLDISTVKTPANRLNVYAPKWLMIVDERVKLMFSSFHERKDGIVEPTCEKFHKW
jgi:hypothetical protein